MKLNDFTLTNFNKFIKEGNKDQTLKFSRMISYALGEKLSVIAEYKPTINKSFLHIGTDGEVVESTDFNDFYYGVSPLDDNGMIIECISNLRFTNRKKLDEFIFENGNLFMCHPDQGGYLVDFARYALLAFASNFCIDFKWNNAFENIIDETDSSKGILKRTDNVLHIKGCPTDEMLKRLSAYRFRMADKNIWEIADDGQDIYDLYKNKSNIHLDNIRVFYSGVFVKPLHLEYVENQYQNDNVNMMKIQFERSTYATVFTLDGNYLNHPLLSTESVANLTKMLRWDDKCKMKLIDASSKLLEEDRVDLDSVNTYLRECINVNQIGVSANIITNDNVLMMGKRGHNTIDHGKLYPSANGNAEVLDNNVSFYKMSVYEDYPSVDLSKGRIDFSGEINRDSYAELMLDAANQEWNCYGIMISGTEPDREHLEDDISEPYAESARRMHFNIIFEHHSRYSFTEICSRSNKATEAFENEKFVGVDLRCYKNPLDFVKKKLLSVLLIYQIRRIL